MYCVYIITNEGVYSLLKYISVFAYLGTKNRFRWLKIMEIMLYFLRLKFEKFYSTGSIYLIENYE